MRETLVCSLNNVCERENSSKYVSHANCVRLGRPAHCRLKRWGAQSSTPGPTATFTSSLFFYWLLSLLASCLVCEEVYYNYSSECVMKMLHAIWWSIITDWKLLGVLRSVYFNFSQVIVKVSQTGINNVCVLCFAV